MNNNHWSDAIALLASGITMCDESVALRHVTRIVNDARAKDAEAHAAALNEKDAKIAEHTSLLEKLLGVDPTAPNAQEIIKAAIRLVDTPFGPVLLRHCIALEERCMALVNENARLKAVS